MIIKMERRSKNPLYNFLMNPRFSKWRYFAFATLIFLISLREVLFTYQSGLGNLKLGGLLVIIIYYLVNLYPAKLILRDLLQKCLENRKYLIFVLSSAGIVLSSILIKFGIEIFLVKQFNMHSTMQNGIGPIAIWEWTTKFVTTLTCIYGIMSIFLLKNWIKEKKKLKKVESEQLKLELEALKEQVDSELLLNTLQGTSEMTMEDPTKASERIKLLSSVLRYELYDCKRPKVLLSSEITFINNVLKLWAYQSKGFEYSIKTEGNLQALLIPPLLLISLVQIITRRMDKDNEGNRIDINISCEDKVVLFSCFHQELKERVMPNIEMLRRLKILFGDKWSVNCELTKTEIKFDMK